MKQLHTFMLAAFCAASLPASASDAELKALREEIARMRDSYERRIAALEKRLEHASAPNPSAPTREGTAPGAMRPVEGQATGFNPEIGLILQGQAKRTKDVPERAVSGYWSAGHGDDKRGLSVDHSELVMSANVDPNFRGIARFAITEGGEVEVEEAGFSTLGLGQGLTLRGGRFASDIGYQNARHAHEWDFADASLMQKVLFGGESYRHDGLQIKWVAPTELLFQLGVELGRGAGFPGTERNKNGAGAGAVFARLGGDVGTSHAWSAGLSFLGTRANRREMHFEDTDPAGPNEVSGVFSGRSRTAIADLLWKWAPGGNARDRYFKFQTELFRRNESGALACESNVGNGTAPCDGGAALGSLSSRQSGGYAQAVWQFMPRWRVGYRHDRLGRGSKSYDAATVFAALGPANHYFADFRPRRDSMMLDWSNSEFSRLRLQFGRDRSMQGITDNQVVLQYIMSLGAHGAHRF